MTIATGFYIFVCLFVLFTIVLTATTTALRGFSFLLGIIFAIIAWRLFYQYGVYVLPMMELECSYANIQKGAMIAAASCFGLFLFAIFFVSIIVSRKSKKITKRGILTNTLTALFSIWMMILAFFYAGNQEMMNYYYQMGMYHSNKGAIPKVSELLQWDEELRKSEIGKVFLQYNPFDDTARTRLACIVIYGCTQNKMRKEQFVQLISQRHDIPNPSRLVSFFEMEELRELSDQGRYAEIFAHTRLKEFIYAYAPTLMRQAKGEEVRTTEDILSEFILDPR